MSHKPRVGVVLTGGGARGAYQAGALCALAEIAKECGAEKPFPVVSGISAGAINAIALAAMKNDELAACEKLRNLWEGLTTDRVFQVGFWPAARTALRWVLELISGGLIPKKPGLALLDTSPLAEMLNDIVDWKQVEQNIEEDRVHSLSITAVNYANGSSRTFYQSHYPYPAWIRNRRSSQPSTIALNHIMASTAIPFLFPPHKIGKWFYGDGSLRNHTPLSAAIKTGAEKLVVIGVRQDKSDKDIEVERPSQGRIFSVLLNSLFLDALDLDMERVQRINETLKYVPATAPTELRPIPLHLIQPSQDIGRIAVEEAHHMPAVTRYLLRGLGTPDETSGLISYLLFEAPYTKRLTQLGYEDTMAQKEELTSLYQ